MFAGNVKPHKNLERLIRAFAIVRAQAGRRDLRLVLIGDDVSRYASLRRTAEEAGVRPDVRFFGFVPHRTLAALYRMASVFAFPSLYEGFGLPPLEAMACGTPVVTSRISSLPEVVGDGALLVDPYSEEAIADGLARVLDDDDLRRRPRRSAGSRGRARSAGSAPCARSTAATCGRSASRCPRRRRPSAEGRARPRLADGHARRGEGAALAVPALPRRDDLHPPPRPRLGRPRDRVARDPHVLRPAPARRREALPPLPARSSRRRSSGSTSAASTSSSRARTASRRARARRRARFTCATATRRCATCGTATTTTSAPAGCRGSPGS